VVRNYDFTKQLVWSHGFLNEGIEKILRSRIPLCESVEQASDKDDRSGVDYWAQRKDLPALGIDVKIRDKDFARYEQDDLALETWSSIDNKVGWTRDATKRTDYILWFWQDTGRFFLVAFPPLCKVFARYWERWRTTYKTAQQNSGQWQSECVFVPRDILIAKLNDWQNGIVC